MGRSEELYPDYSGIKVEHAENWSALNYHNRTPSPDNSSKPQKQRVNPQPLGPLKNVARPQHETLYDLQKRQKERRDAEELMKAKHEDWRRRNLSNNKIQDF